MQVFCKHALESSRDAQHTFCTLCAHAGHQLETCSVQLCTLACVDPLMLSLLQGGWELYSWAQPALLCWLSYSRPAGLLAEPRRGHLEAAAAGPADVRTLAGSAPMRSHTRAALHQPNAHSFQFQEVCMPQAARPWVHPLVVSTDQGRYPALVSSLHSDGTPAHQAPPGAAPERCCAHTEPGVVPCPYAAVCRQGAWMGTESFLLIVAAVVYGYNATMLLFGTFHCLSIICGAYWPACSPVGWPADGGALSSRSAHQC
jgi:hypothetical protein